MKYYKLFLALVLGYLLIGFSLMANNSKGKPASKRVFTELKKRINTVVSVKLIAPRVYAAISSNNELIGYYVESNPKSQIVGYNGPIPLGICLNEKKIVIGISLYPNDETPGYFEHVRTSHISQAWNGKNSRLGTRISPDAISGATISSDALVQTVQQTLKYFNKTISKLDKE